VTEFFKEMMQDETTDDWQSMLTTETKHVDNDLGRVRICARAMTNPTTCRSILRTRRKKKHVCRAVPTGRISSLGELVTVFSGSNVTAWISNKDFREHAGLTCNWAGCVKPFDFFVRTELFV
jgi:hypothetical protein